MSRDDYDDEYDDDDRPRRRRRPREREERSRRRRAEPSGGFFSRLFGGGKKSSPPPRRKGGISFDNYENTYDDVRDYQDRDRGRDRDDDDRPRRSPRAKSKKRKDLIDVCKPVFSYVGVLPAKEGQPGPDFLRFREGVVSALQRIEPDAREAGLEIQDAEIAKYALALLVDEQVYESAWSSKEEWARQPLSSALLNDPEGGTNFFRRLEALRDDQRDVMKIFLYCLALGYCGKYITEDPRKREQQIESIKQDLLRRIGSPQMEGMDRLFPEGYTASIGVEDEVEPPPAWWVWTSIGTVALCVVIWFALFVLAGRVPEPAREKLDEYALRAVATEAYRC